jgi:hypothetical protein
MTYDTMNSKITARKAKTSPPQGRMALIYAHKDRPFLERSRLIDFLEGVARELNFEFWWDKKISQGTFEEEIQHRLKTADVIVCLVSQPFLKSPFITEVEAKIVSGRLKREGLIVLPVIYQECLWQERTWLARLHHFPADQKRPYLHGRNDQVAIFKEIASHILERVKGRGTIFREPRSLYTLRQVLDKDITPEEKGLLLEDSKQHAYSFVPSAVLQQQICQAARTLGASEESPLSKEQLEKLDQQFLGREKRKADPKKIRWVLRANRLHPQGRRTNH